MEIVGTPPAIGCPRREEEKKLWPGRTLEFVAVGWFEEEAFGFPTEPVPVLPEPGQPAV